MSERRWDGDVALDGDVLVPAGARLTLGPGCVVRAAASASPRRLSFEALAFGAYGLVTRPDLRQLVVLGELELLGEPERPIRFEPAGWGGLVVLARGAVRGRHAVLAGEGGAALCADFGRVELSDCKIFGRTSGLSAGGFSQAALRRCSLGGVQLALSCDDDARVRLSSCRVSGADVGISARGRSEVLALGGAVEEQSAAGAVLEGTASWRSRGTHWRRQPVGLSARREARALLRGGRFEAHACGVEALGRSEVRAHGVESEGNDDGAWAQNEARFHARGGAWRANEVGLKVSHQARVEVEDAVFSAHRKAGVMLEENARASLKRAAFEGDENGALVCGGAVLEADGCRFSGCRDHGVWRVRDGRAKLTGSTFKANGRDVN